jgi:hypothetical protein
VEGGSFLRESFPEDQDFGKSGRLVSFLRGREFAFFKNSGESAEFHFTYTISFDTNFCSYIEKFLRGSLDPSLHSGFIAALEYLYPHRDALDIVPYLNEALRNGCLEKRDESIEAYCRYRHSDEDAFRKSRSFVLSCPESVFRKKLTEIQSTVRSADWSKVSEYSYWNYLRALIVLAAAARAHLKGSRDIPQDQYLSVLNTLHFELGAFPQLELFAVQRLILEGRMHGFFGPIVSKSPNLVQRLSAMAWDLSHLRTIFFWSAYNSRLSRLQAPFPVPYFASFDRRFTLLIELLKLNGVIYQRVGNQPHFIHIHGLGTVEKGSALMGASIHLLTPEAKAQRRELSMKLQSTTTLESIANKLVASLETAAKSNC